MPTVAPYGTWTSPFTARRLAEAGISLRAPHRRGDRVFWLEVGDGYVYPAFQIGPSGLLPGIREVLDAFEEHDPWARVSFMLTGDTPAVAQAVANTLGIQTWHAQLLPQDKTRLIQNLQQKGHVVGMVGDGINDAPALAQADISFALGAGTDIARKTADMTLIRNDLRGIPEAISLSRATLKTIRQNLFFAFIYNIIGIPLAALGLLNPVIAALAMAASSVSVITNALRLRGWKP